MIDIGRLVHLLIVRYSAHDVSEKANETCYHLSSISNCISGEFCH